MFKRVSLILIITIFAFVVAFSVQAQQPISFDTLAIDLWPEYDQPNVLVIYKAMISPDVDLPTEVTLRIPAAAGNPFVVAVGPDAASVADVVYQTQVNGEWINVSFIATTPALQFEYYDPNLIKDGTSRSFQYTWLQDIAVQSMIISLQHPIGSSDYVVAPQAGNLVQGDDGFTYTVVDQGAVTAAQQVSLTISYQKSSDNLSVEGMQIEPSAPLPAGPGSAINFSRILPWLLFALALLLIAGGGYWYWRSSRADSSPVTRRHRKPVTSAEKAASSADGIYCHQCGKKAEAGDRYCRSCGVRLRIE